MAENGAVVAGAFGALLTRATAAALALVAVASCVSLVLFFSIGGPFGSLNDLGNGVLAVLCAGLALLLHRSGRLVVTTVAVAGSATAVFGSYLVISSTTGYFLAGLVSALGFALIGLWLIVISRSERFVAARSALVAGAVMALGSLNVVGIVQGLDHQEEAPIWLLAAGICWAGTYLLLPTWAIRLARNGAVAPTPVSSPNRGSMSRQDLLMRAALSAVAVTTLNASPATADRPDIERGSSQESFEDGSETVHVVRTFVPEDPRVPVEKGAGTSFIAPDGSRTVVGTPVHLIGPRGTTLLDAGRVQFDGEGNVISFNGPHPALEVDLTEYYCPS